MLKAKMTLSDLLLRTERVRTIRDSSKMGTTLELQATLKVSKRRAGSLSGEGIDSLDLEWIETCDWFEFSSNRWTFKGTEPNNTNKYAANPSSNTFSAWHTGRYLAASIDVFGNAPPQELKDAVRKAGTEADKAAKHWIAENGFEWTMVVATDPPAMNLNPRGTGDSLVTTNSRRRVLHFDLGFKGSSRRVTATQVLETMNGNPTLHKFLVPGVTRQQANDETNLQRWRQQLQQGQPETFTI